MSLETQHRLGLLSEKKDKKHIDRNHAEYQRPGAVRVRGHGAIDRDDSSNSSGSFRSVSTNENDEQFYRKKKGQG